MGYITLQFDEYEQEKEKQLIKERSVSNNDYTKIKALCILCEESKVVR